MKKALTTAYDIDGIVALENELRNYERTEAQQLESNLFSYNKVRGYHNRAMRELDGDGTEISGRQRQLKDQLSKAKAELKEQNDLLRTEERVMQREHQQMVEVEKKCRQLKLLIKQRKSGSSDPQPGSRMEINENEIDSLQRDIEQMDEHKVKEEQRYKKMVRKLKTNQDEMQQEIDALRLKLKEKEQEGRLNDLKFRELKRGIPHKTLMPLSGHRVTSYHQK